MGHYSVQCDDFRLIVDLHQTPRSFVNQTTATIILKVI